jgi:hypothetical protein
MSKSHDGNIETSKISDDIDRIQRAARLLVDNTRAVRRNVSGSGQKFPVAELAVSTSDFDKQQGSGSRVHYFGQIDRATCDAFSDDPKVTFESGTESVSVPVRYRSPMTVDASEVASMPLEHQELAARIAGDILVAAETAPQQS